MPEHPFEQSTLQNSSSPMSIAAGASAPPTAGVEVRYPPATRTLVPVALILSGFITPLVVFFFLQPPLNLILAIALAIMEFSVAGLIWLIFNTSFLRADESGITQLKFGQTQFVHWEQIANLEMRQVGNGPMQIFLKDAQNKTILTVSDFGNHTEGEKLIDFIESKLQRE